MALRASRECQEGSVASKALGPGRPLPAPVLSARSENRLRTAAPWEVRLPQPPSLESLRASPSNQAGAEEATGDTSSMLMSQTSGAPWEAPRGLGRGSKGSRLRLPRGAEAGPGGSWEAPRGLGGVSGLSRSSGAEAGSGAHVWELPGLRRGLRLMSLAEAPRGERGLGAQIWEAPRGWGRGLGAPSGRLPRGLCKQGGAHVWNAPRG